MPFSRAKVKFRFFRKSRYPKILELINKIIKKNELEFSLKLNFTKNNIQEKTSNL